MRRVLSPRQWSPPSIAAVLGLAVLLLRLVTAAQLGRSGVLHEWDVLFSADPTVYVTSFTTGQNTYRWGGRSFVHPNISNVTYPLVHATATAFHSIRPGVPAILVARRVAYLICPVLSGATAAVLFLLFIELGLHRSGAVLLTALFAVSFSGVVFGSVPESYCLSGLALAGLFWLAARTARDPAGRAAHAWTWIAGGAVLAGITISNIVPFGLVALTVRRARGHLVPRIRWAAVVSTIALAITAAGYAIGAMLAPHAPAFTPRATGQIIESHPFDAWSALVEFPDAVGNALVPPVPLKAPADPALRQEMRFTLTYHTPGSLRPGQLWRSALVLGLLLLAALRARGMEPYQRTVVIAAGLVLAFNWALHSVYGSELFLYSQHWEVAILVVLSALAAPLGNHRRLAQGALAALVVLAAWNTAHVWQRVLRMLVAGEPVPAATVETGRVQRQPRPATRSDDGQARAVDCTPATVCRSRARAVPSDTASKI